MKEELEIKSQKRANIFEIADAFERGRRDAIEEFAERLKEKAYYVVADEKGLLLERNVVNKEDIDNLVKEMTEVSE